MALTVSQMFIGAVSLGIAMFRGTEVNAALHHETTLSHADYGASKLAADHARSANIVVNNNVTMGAIMGPRFGVEGAFERFIRLPYARPVDELRRAVAGVAAAYSALGVGTEAVEPALVV